MKRLNTLFVPTSASCCFIILLLFVCSGSVAAGERHYQAPIDQVVWRTASEKLRCALSHDIPLYGRAIFSQSAGELLAFSMTVRQPAMRKHDRAHLRSLPPEWKHQVHVLDLGEVDVYRGNIPFQLRGKLPRRMLAELGKNMFPTFSYRDWEDAQDKVSVSLPGINISEALDTFSQCLAKLPLYKFSDYQKNLLHFDFGKDELTKAARKQLDKIVEYLQSDPTIKRIEVAGHTDNIGRKRNNDKLGERRGKAVRRYLSTKGISEKIFVIKSYGERKPVKPNRTPEGREENRRVLVKLVK